MSKIYRALLVGLGGIAAAHVRAAQATEGRVEIVAAIDVDGQRAREFESQFGIPASTMPYADALRQVRPDLVIIAAPPGLHAAMSIAAMEAGAWAWCEKPLCASLAEIDEIAAAERRTGCFTSCVFQMRFASSAAHLRHLLDEGALGRPLVAACNTLWYRDPAYYSVPWRGKWSTELGGPTMSQGIHAMDLLLHLLGDWAEVRAMAATLDRAIEVEDVSLAMIRFASGAHASVMNSVLCPRQETYLRLDCQRATIELTYLYAYTCSDWRFTPAADLPDQGGELVRRWNAAPPDVGSTHGAQLSELVRSMDAHQAPLTSGPQARHTLELLTAIYKSALTERPVARDSIQPGDPFYTSLHGGQAPWRPCA
ncbi:MAG TPA: Gfo/Idh/MocA family oxidoreductase [Opitutaceae bacterium]|nr:Gfo/Idh/MocA family oxidoreductase [Opitutaceae bacterium]